MSGMGFIQSSHAVILYNKAMISLNMLKTTHLTDVTRFYYALSACIYPEGAQPAPNNPRFKESDTWPAQPQDAYGLENLASEKSAMHYQKDFEMKPLIGRFHNIYGPQEQRFTSKQSHMLLKQPRSVPVDFQIDILKVRKSCFWHVDNKIHTWV